MSAIINEPDADDMIEYLWSEEDELSGWEREFLESVSGTRAFEFVFSTAQSQKLEDIYRRYS